MSFREAGLVKICPLFFVVVVLGGVAGRLYLLFTYFSFIEL